MKLAVRVFVDGKLNSEQVVTVTAEQVSSIIGPLAVEHARLSLEQPAMIEIEFLDDPNDPARFFRIGSDPRGMVLPVEIRRGDGE